MFAAPGTWNPEAHRDTAAGHAARLDAAGTALQKVAGPADALLAACIAAERGALVRQTEQMRLPGAETFRLWGGRERYGPDALQPFVAQCHVNAGKAAGCRLD